MSIFIRIVNTIVTEIRMSNFYLAWKWNHFIGHQLQVNIEFFLINKLTCNFNMRYFCFSVNYLTLPELKNGLKIHGELLSTKLTFLINLPNTG